MWKRRLTPLVDLGPLAHAPAELRLAEQYHVQVLVLVVLEIGEQADLLEQRWTGKLRLIHDEYGTPSVTVQLAAIGRKERLDDRQFSTRWRVDSDSARHRRQELRWGDLGVRQGEGLAGGALKPVEDGQGQHRLPTADFARDERQSAAQLRGVVQQPREPLGECPRAVDECRIRRVRERASRELPVFFDHANVDRREASRLTTAGATSSSAATRSAPARASAACGIP